MIEINKTQETRANIEAVWKVLSDVEGEQKFWHVLKNVKILSRNGNTIEREATIRRGPMGDAKSTQTLVIEPQEKSISLKMTKGPMLGTRKIILSSVSVDSTKIDVNWQFEMKGVPGFALGFVKDNISEETEKALKEIVTETEALTSGKRDSL